MIKFQGFGGIPTAREEDDKVVEEQRPVRPPSHLPGCAVIVAAIKRSREAEFRGAQRGQRGVNCEAVPRRARI